MDRWSNRWWIPDEKRYRPETTEWWCSSCREIQPIERNPAWAGEYKGDKPAPEWFIRCAVCLARHYQSTEFDCPDCGWDDADDTSMISATKPVHNIAASMNYGGNPLDWDETHRCRACGEEFTFRNGNY